MGRLRNIIEKPKSNKHSGGPFSKELVYSSGIIVHQLGSEIYVGKNRYGEKGFVSLPDVIDDVIKEYFNDRINEGPTVSKMFNIVIVKEIEEAIRNVFIKHKLSN